MANIKFLQDTELEVVESYDEEEDRTELSNVAFQFGEEIEVDIESENDQNTSWQFGDGSMAYCVDNSAFVQFETKNGAKSYKDHEIDGLIVRGDSTIAIVVSKGLIDNFELHVENTEKEDAFMNCVKWRKRYMEHQQSNR